MDTQGFYNAARMREYAGVEQGIASMPFSPGVNNLPVAPGSPWNSRGLAWGMPSPPELVQFTGAAYYNDKLSPSTQCKCKRKSLEDIPAVPAKQLITEEKMAAHFNSLHLSSDFTSHTSAESMDVMMDARDGETLAENIKGTIKLSEEVKRIREEPLLPAVLIERLEKPTMSLVVWQPREDILQQVKKESKPEDEEEKKRNGVLVGSCNSDVDMWSSGTDWSGHGSCI